MRTVRFVNQPSDRFGPLRILRRRDFEVEGTGFFEASDEALLAPLAVVKEASLTSLRHAVDRYNKHNGASDDPLLMLISEDAPETFDTDFAVYVNTQLNVSPDAIAVVLERGTHELERREPVARLLRPLLKKCRGTLSRVMPIESPRGSSVEVTVEISSRGRTVSDALEIGEDIGLLLEAAFATGPLRAATAAELIRTGHHEVLSGQPESDWLDAKGRLYELGAVGNFLLAGDVAAFANAGGGVIVIGLRTSRTRGQDIISRSRPVDLADFNLAKHHAVIRDWIYPRPRGVRFDLTIAETDPEKGLVVIEIPEQPEALKPFFVRRAQLAGRVRTEHLALPIRVGDATSHWDLAELHSLIIAGRAALAQPRAPTAEEPGD
jgi:hypothetical protein